MRRLTVDVAEFPLRRPFRIARGVKSAARVVTARIAEGERWGWGEGVPYARYGESVESVLAQIESARPAVEAGADRDALLALLPAGSARNALDCALWHLEARRAGEPAWRLAGLPQLGTVETAVTVSLDAPELMAAEARGYASAARAMGQDAPLIKVKLNQDAVTERLQAVHEAEPAARLIADANESWTSPLLDSVVDRLAALGVIMIEQPLPAGGDLMLERGGYPVPVCADESCLCLADLTVIADRYDAINIKLDKCGGLTSALVLLRSAREMNLRIMLGCMVGSSLAMAPALLMAPLVDLVDLDGSLLLAADREWPIAAVGQYLRLPDPRLWG